MTTDHDLDALDARGSTAGADLRARAAARPVPTFDPGRSPDLVVARPAPVRHGRTFAAVAAALVLLAGGAAWWATRPEGDQGRLAHEVVSGDPRPFVAGDVPKGLELYGAFDLGPGSSDVPGDPQVGSLVLYGPDARHPEVGLLALHGDNVSFSQEAAEIDLGGGRIGRDLSGQGLGRRAIGIVVGDTSVMLTSSTLERQALIDLVPAVHVDGPSVEVDLAEAPDGWIRLGEAADATVAGNPIMVLRGSDTSTTLHSAVYVDASADPEGDTNDLTYASVASAAGGEVQAFAPAVFVGDREDVEVRGHAAVLGKVGADAGTGADLSGWAVSWVESTGEVVYVSAYGLERDQVLALAEGVEPVGADRWGDLVQDTRLGDLGSQDEAGVAIGRGTFDDGTAWALRYVAPDPTSSYSRGDLDLKVALEGGTSSRTSAQGSEIGPDGEVVPTTVALDGASVVAYGDRAFAFGQLSAEVATVEVRDASGAAVAAATIVEGDRLRAYVVEVPGGPEFEVVALDASGQVLATSSAEGPEDDGVEWDTSDISEEGSGTSETTTVVDEACTSIMSSGGDPDECGQPAPDPSLPGD